jgi:hypothetical protein
MELTKENIKRDEASSGNAAGKPAERAQPAARSTSSSSSVAMPRTAESASERTLPSGVLRHDLRSFDVIAMRRRSDVIQLDRMDAVRLDEDGGSFCPERQRPPVLERSKRW